MWPPQDLTLVLLDLPVPVRRSTLTAINQTKVQMPRRVGGQLSGPNSAFAELKATESTSSFKTYKTQNSYHPNMCRPIPARAHFGFKS